MKLRWMTSTWRLVVVAWLVLFRLLIFGWILLDCGFSRASEIGNGLEMNVKLANLPTLVEPSLKVDRDNREETSQSGSNRGANNGNHLGAHEMRRVWIALLGWVVGAVTTWSIVLWWFFFRPKVKVHTPLPARADVETEVES